MKRLLAALLLIVSLNLVGFAPSGAHADVYGNLYPSTMIVTEVEDNLVIAEDFFGNVWGWYGSEEFDVNDMVSVILYDNGTDKIWDDEIVLVRWAGRLEGWCNR